MHHARPMKAPDGSRLGQERRFADIVGHRFLAFVCAASEDQIKSRLHAGEALRRKQEDVVAQVLEAAAQSALVAFQTGGPEDSFLYPLFEYDETAKTSVPNALRRAAGGEVPTIRYRDNTERRLAELTRDVYPLFLIESRGGLRTARPRWFDRPSSAAVLLFRHPARLAFDAAVERDSTLMRMFPHETPGSGKTGFVWTSLDTGRSTQLSMLADDLLSAALLQVTLDGTGTQEGFVAAAIDQLRMLWRLLDGERVCVRCTLAFVGAELAGNALETPWGLLRSPSAGELKIRAGLPVAHSQELTLATEVPLQITVGDWGEQSPDASHPSNPFTDETQAAFADLQRKADRVALTLLLGIDRAPVVAVARTWTLVENPLNQAPSLSWTQNAIPLHPHVLRQADRRRISAWAERIDRHYSDRIDIAVKRTLTSLTGRWDATDRLIDAVIALENLFGTGSGELKFRISSGCARLLESDAARRSEMQRVVSKLYDRRSNIVHGAHAPPPDALTDDAQAAALLAVRSLRVLFSRRQDLLNTEERSRRLVLGLR